MRARFGVFVLLVALQARAEETKHTVKPHDTCAALAERYYGDARMVDVIHKANPTLLSTPPPHNLVPGTVLIIPPKPSTGTGPDAQLTTVRNRVDVLAPEAKQGKPNDPLFRGNRVSTQASSAADVTFRDETQVKLGERTLVIILGDAKSAASKQDAQTELVTGNLRAWMAGPRKDTAAAVATPAANVKVWSGEAVVSNDEKKTTRLSVQQGSSTITAQNKSQEIAKGFGSKAELGKPPTPPHALPPAPTFAVLPTPVQVGDASLVGEVDLPPNTLEWRVQVAHEASFGELVTDATSPASVRRFIIQSPKANHYFVRVSAIDDDHFEGPFSRTIRSLVIAPRVTKTDTGRQISIEPPTAACMRVGNSRLTWIKQPFEVAAEEPVFLRCAPSAQSPTTLLRVD